MVTDNSMWQPVTTKTLPAYFETSVGTFYTDGSSPGALQAKITLKNGSTMSVPFAVAQTYMTYRSHSKLGTLSDQALLAFARAEAASSLPLDQGQMVQLGIRYGVPVEWWLTASAAGGGGGAGSGVNRENEIRSLVAIISDEAAKLGIPMTADEIAYIAGVAQKQSWTQAQIVDSITAKLNFETLQSGTIKASLDKFTAASKNYLVPLSSDTLNQYAARIAKGETTEDAVMTAIREAAKAANPWLASYIDQGLSPTDVLAPNRDFVAQQLEINPLEIDFMKASDMAMFMQIGEDGKPRMANQSELTRKVRKDDRWRKTNNAKQLGAEMGSLLARVFGRSAF